MPWRRSLVSLNLTRAQPARWWDLLAIVLCYTSWDRRYLTVGWKIMKCENSARQEKKCPREKWTARVRQNEEELCHYFLERENLCVMKYFYFFSIYLIRWSIHSISLCCFVYAACNLLGHNFHLCGWRSSLCMHHQVVDQSSTTSSRTCITTENKNSRRNWKKKIHSTHLDILSPACNCSNSIICDLLSSLVGYRAPSSAADFQCRNITVISSSSRRSAEIALLHS